MFKTKREARLNLSVNYLCYALRALFWTLIIINWTLIIINWTLIISLIFSLMFILAKQTNCKFTHTIRYRVKTFYLHICVKYRNFADEIRKEDRFGCLQPLKNNAKTRNHERPLIIKRRSRLWTQTFYLKPNLILCLFPPCESRQLFLSHFY